MRFHRGGGHRHEHRPRQPHGAEQRQESARRRVVDAGDIDEHHGKPREADVHARRRDREGHRERPRERHASEPTEHLRRRLVDLVPRLRPPRLPHRSPSLSRGAHHHRHPRHDRRQGEHGPQPEREPPARGIRHRHRHERRHERGHRQQRRVESGHRAGAVGEVLLDEGRQHDVPDADRREQHRRAEKKQQGVGCQGAADHRGRRHDHRRRSQPLESEAPLEGGRDDAEHRETDRRRRADQPEDPGGHREVGPDLGEDRRERGDRRPQREGDQHDAEECENPPLP